MHIWLQLAMYIYKFSCLHAYRISLGRLEQGLPEAERRRQDQVDIKSLQILRAIIYNQIIQIDPELKERNPPEYRE